MTETYFKVFEDLNRTELICLYDSLENKVYPCKIPVTDKASIILNILSLNSDFFDPLNKKFCFEDDTQFIKFLDNAEPDDSMLQKYAKSHHKNNLEDILASSEASSVSALLASLKVEESDNDENSENDSSDSSEDEDDANNTVVAPVKREPVRKSKTIKKENEGKARLKIGAAKDKKVTHVSQQGRQITHGNTHRLKSPKYDSALPVSAWIRNMEIYGKVASLNDEELITTALSSLLSEEEGSHIIASLTDNELRKWNRFKDKLEDVLGHTRDHWKYLFENYQRGADSFGVAMAKLTSYYRQGYNISQLRQHDQELLVERFCKCQDDRMQELLLREKCNLNVSTIVKRANELERSIPKRENLFAISSPQSDNEKITKQLKLLSEEFGKLKTEIAENGKKKQQAKKRSKIDIDRAEGYCIKYINTKNCRYGSDCKYIHSTDVPKSVADYAKSLL